MLIYARHVEMFARKCSLLFIVPSQTRMMMMFGADATSTFWIYVKQISLSCLLLTRWWRCDNLLRGRRWTSSERLDSGEAICILYPIVWLIAQLSIQFPRPLQSTLVHSFPQSNLYRSRQASLPRCSWWVFISIIMLLKSKEKAAWRSLWMKCARRGREN